MTQGAGEPIPDGRDAGTDEASPWTRPEVRRFVAMLWVAAGVLTVAASALSLHEGVGPLLAVSLIAGLTIGSNYYSMHSVRSGPVVFDFFPAFFVVALLLIRPLGLVAILLLSYVPLALMPRIRLITHLSNVAELLMAGSAGILASIAVDALLDESNSAHVCAALVGTAVMVVTRSAAFEWGTRLRARSTEPFARMWFEAFSAEAFQTGSTGALGLMAGIAGQSFSWAPLLVVPTLATIHLVESRHQRAVVAGNQIEGLFQLALDAHSTVVPTEIERSLTTAARSMLYCQDALMIAQGPEEQEIGAEVSQDQWLVARRVEAGDFDSDDQLLVDAIASIGRSALRSSELIEQIRWQGTHDERTGLPNQTLFDDRVAQSIQLAHRDKSQLAVLCVNLDGFRRINESFGFEAGDIVLTTVAERLQRAVREIDTVARMAADQFMLLLPSVGVASTVQLLAERVLHALSEPFPVASTELYLTASVGVAVFPEHGVRSSELLRNAESALHTAKADGGNAMRLYSPEMNEFAHLRLSRESELHSAIDGGELTVRYQPFVDLATGRTVGVEALVRWNHPVHGLLYPDEFVPLAEESGLILALDAWVLKAACRQCVSWSAMGLPPLRMACNLSGRHFQDDGIVSLVQQTLAETRLAPERLELEITERVALRDGTTANGILTTLRQMGVSLSIDDFGTGYSALAQLQRMAVDRLKVDRSFVAQITSPTEPAPLVTAFLAMAKALGLEVIAEGVETIEQRDFLRAHGCEEAQGYLFAKPLAPDDLAALVGAEVLWSALR